MYHQFNNYLDELRMFGSSMMVLYPNESPVYVSIKSLFGEESSAINL